MGIGEPASLPWLLVIVPATAFLLSPVITVRRIDFVLSYKPWARR